MDGIDGMIEKTKFDVYCCDVCKNYYDCDWCCGYARDRRNWNASKARPLESLKLCNSHAALKCAEPCPGSAAGFIPMSHEEAMCDAL